MKQASLPPVSFSRATRHAVLNSSPSARLPRVLTLAAVLASVGFFTLSPARADYAVQVVKKGEDGKDGETAFGWSSATAGKDAEAASLNQTTALHNVSTAIKVGSQGGAGGSVYTKGVFHNVPGKPGGNAGPVSLEVAQSADLSATLGNATLDNPVIQVYSRGGTGGFGYTSWTESDGGISRGGEAGAVTVTLASTVTASSTAASHDKSVAAISVLSEGGAAGVSKTGVQGNDGTYKERVDTDRGGSGGKVSVTLAESSTVTVSGAGAAGVSASSIGGNGGRAINSGGYPSNAGVGGDVDFTNRGKIQTAGAQSSAVIVQSVGGTGGNGANGAFTSGTPGGNGGAGGKVDVTNTGAIAAKGEYSFGVVAQSVGGVGGSGGGAAFVSGGDGGGAGLGGDVTVKNMGRDSSIQTSGAGGSAIVAQSIGGGNALDAFHASRPAISGSGGSGGRSGILPYTSGGAGGLGGVGGKVKVENEGNIETFGDSAFGVIAQSVGGGGGTGGAASSNNAFLSVALGGAGGGGGNGGEVIFQSTGGSISTSGKGATAVLAQSVGGGGGTGGYATSRTVGPVLSAASSTGGSGGLGGKGGAVTISNRSAISTSGERSVGLQATSIGGGGGTGGGADAFAVALPVVTPSGKPLPAIAITDSIGGSGGDGGAGMTAQIDNLGVDIDTLGVGATGILAQSIGGGGGNGGNAMAYGLAIAAPGASAFNLTHTVGGSGGGGGAGDLAKVNNTGNVSTAGIGAVGINVQSIGGGGGNAGFAVSSADALSLYQTMEFNQTIGGSNAAGGGKGGTVDLHHSGRVDTRGSDATGILLQSIGGGGGNGGAVNASATSGLSLDKTLNELIQQIPLADSVTIIHAVGGTGGNGGDGGDVKAVLDKSAYVTTRGGAADGVMAQSIGGGGGRGAGGAATASGTFSAKYTVGGQGGAGGAGGRVTVENAGHIKTSGDSAHGIVGQSIGGGGGSGGNLRAAPDTTPDTVGEVWAVLKHAVGVDVYDQWAKDPRNNEARDKMEKYVEDLRNSGHFPTLWEAFGKSGLFKDLHAAGNKVTDYLNQQSQNSVKRPNVSLTLALGGDGGMGNRGGWTKLTNEGVIETTGALSHGMLAQAIGGGGGQGGVAYASGTNRTNLSATLGGNGGQGNSGGEAWVENFGTITTAGDGSYGLLAQSIGGGGGIGVGALSSGNAQIVLNFTLGGTGGQGASGGLVNVKNTNTISTQGAEAHALVAQSIGGGGGAFMMAPSERDATDAPSDPEAVKESTIMALLKAAGIEKVPAAAPPSDEKTSWKSGSFTLGGAGGASGAGGEVKLIHSGTITTSGRSAYGILAQSIGGGGGLSNAAGSPGGVKFAVSLGGKGGAAGNGGNVHVQFEDKASIKTTGSHATAVLAQSIGGGGGHGGASVLEGWTVPVLGGAGGSSGNGGAIDVVTANGSTAITTSGEKAHGVWAQSLGGGGGVLSASLKTDTHVRAALETTAAFLNNLIAKAGASGTILDHLDQIDPDYHSIVKLFGNDKDTVQSALDKLKATIDKRNESIGTGGDIRIRFNGNIDTQGAGAYGIFAQSGFQNVDGVLDASRAGGNIVVDYTGELKGGSQDGAAIVVDGGRSNTILINAGSKVSARSGTAVISTFGNDSLHNAGTLIGDIDLASGNTNEWNDFDNGVNGTYITGATGKVRVGNGRGRFNNEGILDIGGVGTIANAEVESEDVVLGGKLRVDVNSVAAAGTLNSDHLQGPKIIVNGVEIRPHAVEGLLRESDFTVVSADTLETKQAATAWAHSLSPVTWSLNQRSDSISVSPHADFIGRAPGTLTATEQSLLESLQVAWDTGNTSMAGLFANMANIDSAQKYDMTINSLTPTDDLGQAATGQTLAGRQSLNAALSCPVFDGGGVTLRETQCVWGRVSGSRAKHSSGVDSDGYSRNGTSYRVGAQWQIRPDWFVGATAAYSTDTLNTSDHLTSIRGDSGDVSVSLKHQRGPWLFAGALHAGYGRYDSSSLFVVGNDTWSAENSNDVWTAGARLRAAYELEPGNNWYVRPYVDLDVMHTYMPSYTLRGDGATLSASATKEWTVALSPNIEAGTRIDMGQHGWLRPYVSVGATFLNNKGLESEVTFTDGPGRGIQFTSSSALPQRMLNLGAGLQLFKEEKYELRAEYKAQIGKDYRNQELSLRMAIPF